MKQDIILILCLVALNAGLFGVFFAKDIVNKSSNIMNKLKAVRVFKVIGFVVVILALCAIYFYIV